MGMYDYLGNTQVKCFYDPIVEHDLKDFPDLNREEIASLQMWPTTGSLREFKFMSMVPWKTMWYDYGKKFMVFDPDDVEGTGLIHVILGGRYIRSIHYSKLNTKLCPIVRVISKVGDELNITRKEQFQEILDHKKSLNDTCRQITKAYWEDPKNHNKSSDEAMRELDEKTSAVRKVFADKWISTNRDIQDGWTIGAFLYGLYEFCEDDETIRKYVNFLKDHVGGNEALEDEIDKYALWCAKHEIKIYHSDLQMFFMNFPTVRNLEKVIRTNLWK